MIGGGVAAPSKIVLWGGAARRGPIYSHYAFIFSPSSQKLSLSYCNKHLKGSSVFLFFYRFESNSLLHFFLSSNLFDLLGWMRRLPRSLRFSGEAPQRAILTGAATLRKEPWNTNLCRTLRIRSQPQSNSKVRAVRLFERNIKLHGTMINFKPNRRENMQ